MKKNRFKFTIELGTKQIEQEKYNTNAIVMKTPGLISVQNDINPAQALLQYKQTLMQYKYISTRKQTPKLDQHNEQKNEKNEPLMGK